GVDGRVARGHPRLAQLERDDRLAHRHVLHDLVHRGDVVERVQRVRRQADVGGGQVADEDTVWRLWPMLWDLGGDVIGAGGRGIGFADQGVRALEVVRDLAAAHAVYLDPKTGSEQMYQAFEAGNIGMVATGPWQLPDIT